MTDQTSGAEAPPSTVASDLAPPWRNRIPFIARIEALETQSKTLLTNIGESVHPRLQAIEEALEALAKRAEAYLPDSIVNELSELKMVVASLGGGVTGATGHDGSKFFHTWWDRITGKGAPAPGATTHSAGGGSVTNETAPKEIPLSPPAK